MQEIPMIPHKIEPYIIVPLEYDDGTIEFVCSNNDYHWIAALDTEAQKWWKSLLLLMREHINQHHI